MSKMSSFSADYRCLIGQIKQELDLELDDMELDDNPNADHNRDLLLCFTNKLDESENRFIEIHQKHKFGGVVYLTMTVLICCFVNWVRGSNDLASYLIPFILFYSWLTR